MRELKIIEKITDKIWIAIISWAILFSTAKLMEYINLDQYIIGQTIIVAFIATSWFILIKGIFKISKTKK